MPMFVCSRIFPLRFPKVFPRFLTLTKTSGEAKLSAEVCDAPGVCGSPGPLYPSIFYAYPHYIRPHTQYIHVYYMYTYGWECSNDIPIITPRMVIYQYGWFYRFASTNE